MAWGHRWRAPDQGLRPGRHIGVGIDCGVGGLLDEIDRWTPRRRRHRPSRGPPRPDPTWCDRVPGERSSQRGPEVDDRVVDRVLGRPQGRYGAVDLRGVRAIAQRVVANPVGLEVRYSTTSGAQYTSASANTEEPQDVIEVLVRQHDMGNRVSRNPADVASIAAASTSVVPVSMSTAPVRPRTSPIVTSQKGQRQRCTRRRTAARSAAQPGT